ncbi:MAG: sorbosone dehydrogenase family protein [Phycisphaerales bacterium]
MRNSLIAACGLGLLACCAVARPLGTLSATAATAPGSVNSSVAMVPDPRNNDVFYVVQQTGLIRAVNVTTGAVLGDFGNFSGMISTGSERGLLGLAFDPDFANNNRCWVNFTSNGVAPPNPPGASTPPFGATVIARFNVNVPSNPADPLTANMGSRFDMSFGADLGQTTTRWIVQDFSNHNGGTINFGPDNMLYIGMGDGGSGGDPNNRAQTASAQLGKMLRIDVRVPDADVEGYDIPADNPFLPAANPPIAGARPQIWAFGVRNPWKHSFDNVGAGATGDYMIADVGQNAVEEINRQAAGAGGNNWGWRWWEGNSSFNQSLPIAYNSTDPNSPYRVLFPIHTYSHSFGVSITGGFVYRGVRMCSFKGRYFYADYGSGRVWSVKLDGTNNIEHSNELFGATRYLISSFGRGNDGELYILRYHSTSGQIFRITSNDVPLLGDINGDMMVNFADLNFVLSAFGTTYTFADLNNVLSEFGQSCGD